MSMTHVWRLLAVSMLIFSCDRPEESMPPSDLPTVTLHDSSDDEALLTTEKASEEVQIALNSDLVPVFRAVDGGFELLTNCEYPGTFGYQALSVSHTGTTWETVSGATLTVRAGAAEVVNAGFERQQTRQFQIGKAGYHELLADIPTTVDLRDCPEATHVAKVIYVGAFAEATAKKGSGGVRAGTGTVGAGGGHKRSQSEAQSVGILSKCTADEIAQTPEAPPHGCEAPIRVKLVPIERVLRYHFERRTVEGSHSQEEGITAEELVELGGLLEADLRKRGDRFDVQVVPVDDPSKADVRCLVHVNTGSKRYMLKCVQGVNMLAQEGGERSTLGYTTSMVAAEVIRGPGEYRRQPEVGRLVILVDVSTSMVINDERTFMYDDVGWSIRHGLVDSTLGGLLLHDITPRVSIVAFAGPGCVRTADMGGGVSSTLTTDSRQAGLQWLEGVLQVSPCVNGTDIVGALREAKSIFDSTPRSESGHDAIILITDGSHRDNTQESTPRDIASSLVDAGVELHVIRVQLNDIDPFRGLMDKPRTRKAILARWTKFSGESEWEKVWGDPPEKAWAKEISGTSDENKGGADLLNDLRFVNVSTLILNDDDLLRDPLIMANRFLLSKFGALPVIDTMDCGLPKQMPFPDGETYWQRSCKFYNVPLGREVKVKVAVPRCMRKVVGATFEVPGWAGDLALDRVEGSASDATVQFSSVRPGRSEPGKITGVEGTLTIWSDIEPEEWCK